MAYEANDSQPPVQETRLDLLEEPLESDTESDVASLEITPEDEFWSDRFDDAQYAWGPSKHEVTTLRDYLNEERTDPAQAARTFWTTSEDERRLDGLRFRVAVLFHDTLLALEEKHTRLVRLLLAIGNMQPQEMGWTDEQKERFPNWKDWTDVQAAIMWRLVDYRQAYWAHRIGEEPGKDVEASIERYRVISAFFATWSVLAGDWSCLAYGCFTIRKALELNPPGTSTDDTSTLEKQALILDAEIAAGSQYLRFAGQSIYQCQGRPEVEKILFPIPSDSDQEWRTRCLWRGSSGFSTARWEFWKERLTDIQKNKCLMTQTHIFIEQSLTWMEEAQNEVDRKRAYIAEGQDITSSTK